MKKLLLGLGTIAAVTAPIVAVVSCGDNEKGSSWYGEAEMEMQEMINSGWTYDTDHSVINKSVDYILRPTTRFFHSNIHHAMVASILISDSIERKRKEAAEEKARLEAIRYLHVLWIKDGQKVEKSYRLKNFNDAERLRVNHWIKARFKHGVK